MNIYDMDNYELDIFLDYLNDIIKQSVIHGGDCGGAYYTNYKHLETSIYTLIFWLGIKERVVLYKKDNIPMLIIKENLDL